jgi:hypothetical protein
MTIPRTQRARGPQKLHPRPIIAVASNELADCAMLSCMSSLSALVELVRNVLGVFIDALSFFRLTLRSPSALAAENLFLRKTCLSRMAGRVRGP